MIQLSYDHYWVLLYYFLENIIEWQLACVFSENFSSLFFVSGSYPAVGGGDVQKYNSESGISGSYPAVIRQLGTGA